MNASSVALGIMFMCIGIFAVFVPDLGLLAPGEAWDPRIGPVCFVFGIAMLIFGAVSKKEKKTIPQPIQVQPPQQIVKTLLICPKCGNRVPAESKFCLECGASLTPAKPRPPNQEKEA